MLFLSLSPPIHGTRYSVCHKDITEDERHANGSIIDDNQIPDNVVKSGEQPLDMMKRNDSISADTVISHDQPVDMTVSSKNVDVNRSEANVDNSDANNLEGSHEDKNESYELNTVSHVESTRNDLQHPDSILEQPNMTEGTVGNSDISNIQGFVHEDNQNSLPNIPDKVSTSQQIKNEISADSPHCEVNIERTDIQHSDSIIQEHNDTEQTVESTYNSQVEGYGQNENDKSLGNISAEVPIQMKRKFKILLKVLIQKVMQVNLQHK